MRKVDSNWVKSTKELIITGLRNKLSNHSCIVTQTNPNYSKMSLGTTIIIAYMGSTDPGTIKSKYIPTISDIIAIINNLVKSSPLIKLYKGETLKLELKEVSLKNSSLTRPGFLDSPIDFDDDLEWSVLVNLKYWVTKADDLTDQFTFDINYFIPSNIGKYVLGK